MAPSTEAWRSEVGRVVRFAVVGGSNTLVTGVAFVFLAKVLHARLAYTIVFAGGLAYTTLLTGRYVFRRRRPTARRIAAFVAWYLGVYVVGLGTLMLARRYGVRAEEPLAVVVIGVTAPLNYLGGRLIFHRVAEARRAADPPPSSSERSGS